MRTNIDIDENDIKEVMEYFNVTTKKEAVNMALKEVLRLKGLEITRSLKGTGWGWPDDEKKSKKKAANAS